MPSRREVLAEAIANTSAVRGDVAAGIELDRAKLAKLDDLIERLEARRQAAGDGPLTDEDLVYAARQRCRCGAGLAYVEFTADLSWRCSRVLKGEVSVIEPVGSHTAHPATFTVLSERTHSLAGLTTRPSKR